MAECSKCRASIRGESGIRCMGVCDKVYHNTIKCSGLDQYSAKTLESNNFIRFICDDCIQYIHNIDLVLREIQEEVHKNKQNLVEYKHEFESSLKQNESEIKQLLGAIEKRYEERMRKMDAIQKSCQVNVDEVKKLYSYVNEFEKNNKQMCKTIEEKNINMCNELKKVIKQTNENQNKISYAESVKNKIAVPDQNKQLPLIVKPREKQGVDKTKEELNKKVDPINLKITNVENRRNGTVIIQSENSEEREKIKSAIQNELNDNYEIRVPRPMQLKIKITGMTFDYEENELIQKLRKQNKVLNNDNEVKIVKKYVYKGNNKTIYNIILIVDNDAYNKLIAEQKVNIGWDRCRVFDGTDLMQCLKCKGYNHMAKDCKNQEMCLKCHGTHRTRECEKEQIIKCINCVRMNNKLNMGLDENHLTNDKECEVYKNKLYMKRKRMALTMKQL